MGAARTQEALGPDHPCHQHADGWLTHALTMR